MNVVAHTAKGVDPIAIACDTFLEQQIQVVPIVIAEEDRLSCIAAYYHMVNSAWHMNSWFARHKRVL